MIARRIIRHPAPKFHKELMISHRGCGKSTELHNLRAELHPMLLNIDWLMEKLNQEQNNG